MKFLCNIVSLIITIFRLFTLREIISSRMTYGIYHGNGQKCRYISEISVHVKFVYAVHFESREILLKDSPHYQFIKDYCLYGSINLCYAAYQRRQYNFNNKQLADRISGFCELIDIYRSDDTFFMPLMRIDNQKRVVIVDGFHRMAIIAYFDFEKVIFGKLTI